MEIKTLLTEGDIGGPGAGLDLAVIGMYSCDYPVATVLCAGYPVMAVSCWEEGDDHPIYSYSKTLIGAHEVYVPGSPGEAAVAIFHRWLDGSQEGFDEYSRAAAEGNYYALGTYLEEGEGHMLAEFWERVVRALHEAFPECTPDPDVMLGPRHA